MSAVWVLTDRRYLSQRMPSVVIDRLRARPDMTVEVVCADEELVEIGAIGRRSRPGPGDVVLPRTRHPLGLALLARAELDGAIACNPHAAVLAVRDKAYGAVLLARHGVPVPRTFLATEPRQLRELPAGAWPLLLKPVLGDNGRGIERMDGPADIAELTWPHDMVFAQRYVEVAGVDLKVYGVGDAVWAVRRRSPLRSGPDVAVRVPVEDGIRSLAYACRDVFGLTCYGLDVLPTADGPLVVDVNDFPNYTGVPEAAAAIERQVLALARRSGAARCAS